MGTNQNDTSFYGEVDRFRYRTDWGCLGWLLVILLVALVIGWWVWRKL